MANEKQRKMVEQSSQEPNADINLPLEDIKTEPGQPTFKQALQTVLAKPKTKKKD